MNRIRTVVLWHGAITVLHRRVALAAFLRHAQQRVLAVYYSPGDPAARDVQAAARAVAVALHEAPSAVPDRPGAWAWIGTHGVPPVCDTLAGHATPPEVILCLSRPSPAVPPPGVPPGHRVYVTNTPWS